MTSASPLLEAALSNPAQDAYDNRMASVPDIYKTAHERMACELALDMDDADAIFARYGYTPEQAVALTEQPGFAHMLERIATEIHASGFSFKAKIRAIAEDLLPHMHTIAIDPTAPTAERVKIGVWAAKLSGHEPQERTDKATTGGGLNLVIQFSGSPPQTIVAHEPQLIEQK